MLCAGTSSLFAQSNSISGSVYSQEERGDKEPLGGVNILLLTAEDSSRVGGTASANNGAFSFDRVEPGRYLIVSTFLGFTPNRQEVTIEDEPVRDLEIVMIPSSLQLQEFQVSARRARVDVRGDTTAFHAGGYRGARDANVQDLVTRMPGFIIEDGRLQAQGEEVARILLDGEEFFGDDAALALQNLPSEIVDQIEVFDRESDQARFTGFRDGNTSRTINIVTRDGMNRGQFGRANSGYGSQTRYMAGGNYNYFRGSQRFSLIGMTNNINQQNFSSEDLLGISQASGSGGGRGRGGGQATRNFRTGGQSGISSVHSGGMNYNDRWGDSWRVNASYFFNMSDNENDQDRERLYLTGFSADQQYDERSRSLSDNYNHRFDARMEYTIDDRRSLILTPSMSFQRNSSFQTVDGFTVDQNRQLLNEIARTNSSDQIGYNINNTALYRHRFETRGRTFSANLRTNFSDRSGERFQLDDSRYFEETQNRIINDQQTETLAGGYTLSGNFSYTEPLTESTQLLVSYQPSVENNRSEQDVFRFDELTGSYTMIDTTLTNRYDNRVYTNNLRGSYRYSRESWNANVSLSWQHTALRGEQTFPMVTDIGQTWQNILPGANVQYRFTRTTNMRFTYNSSTRTPSVRQLQDVIDNSDPLRLSTGNPDLRQQYDHRFTLRFRHANPEVGSSTSSFIAFTLTDNYIGNRTLVAENDTPIDGDIILRRGARLVSPDNIGRSWNLFSNLNRSLPVDLISSNMSLSAGVGYSRRPSFIDNQRNMTDNIRLNSGINVSSNISDRVDFRVSYNANYNIVENSIRPELDNNYYAGRATGAFRIMPFGGLELGSDFNVRHYAGLGDDFNQTSLFWNGSIAYKFLEDEVAEFRMTLFDILGQNNNINRTIQEDYIEDYRNNVLSRYVLFSFSYRFRSFGGRG